VPKRLLSLPNVADYRKNEFFPSTKETVCFSALCIYIITFQVVDIRGIRSERMTTLTTPEMGLKNANRLLLINLGEITVLVSISYKTSASSIPT
jgi:hypothetical protein